MLLNSNTAILVTGGTGSFGRVFIQKLLVDKCFSGRLIIFSRDEYKQYKLKLQYPCEKFPNLEFVLGDIRDKESLVKVFKGVDYVVHAAALKHVTFSELNVMEFVKTNTIGSENVVSAALINSVKKVIAISTDKVVNPGNVYGATKLCAEKIFISANSKYVETCFSVVRYGNVLGSRGSILPYLFEKRNEAEVSLTNKEMTRFFVHPSTTVDATLFALQHSCGGEIFIPKSRSVALADLAKLILPKVKLNFVGEKPGEKIHEELVAEGERKYTYEIPDYYIISPSLQNQLDKDFEQFKPEKVSLDFSFSSNNKSLLLHGEELRIFIERENLINS